MYSTLRAGLIALCICLSSAADAQSPELFSLPGLRITSNGVLVEGEREIGPQGQTKTTAERKALLASARKAVSAGSALQLKVEIAGSGGTWLDVTSSPLLRYESLGCLTVASAGLVSIVPSSDLCFDAKNPELWIALVDAQGQTTAWNRIFFKLQ